MSRILIALLLASVVALSGCAARNTLRPVESHLQKFTLPTKKDAAFDAMLATAQELGLQIDVIEKASGLLQFKNASLSYSQLDMYCLYPAIRIKDGKPYGNFSQWNQRAMRSGQGVVHGIVSLNILALEVNGETNVTMRGKWISSSARESVECQSNNVFEKEFETKTIERLKALIAAQENK
ncbi:MAG: hypothetical protein FWC38_00860 [Proteobacteria bacterium]|nr:hypothetical protein [Pseudomonadota bacterium]MCL2306793.1 hypothetical protein [Pseudomonadota bacterium]